MEHLRIAFAPIPSQMYPYLITALIIGLAGGLILGLTFVYSILFTPMQRRLKREVVNIQMDNEKLKKDFSHYKRRARRKLKHYRELEMRSGRTDIYAHVEEEEPNPEDQVEEAIDRAITAVKSLPPETSDERKRRDRYARAARGEALSERKSASNAAPQTVSLDADEIDDGDINAAFKNETQNAIPESQVKLSPNAVLDDLTDLALEAKKVKNPRSTRKSRKKTSFLDNLRRKQENLANQVTETDEYGTTGLTQTIEMPLREDDVDNWQDFESEVERELSDTSHALDIYRDSDEYANNVAYNDLRVDAVDVREKSRGGGRQRGESWHQRAKRGKSLLKPRVAVVDSTLDEPMESTVPPPRITSRDDRPGDVRSGEANKARKPKKAKPDEGFMKALRSRRRGHEDDVDDDFDVKQRTGS